MATATVTADEILAERWHMATTRVRREYEGRALVAICPDNSKAVEEIYHAVETLAARLVEEVHEDTMDDLMEIIGGLLEGPIKAALFAFAAPYAAGRVKSKEALTFAAEHPDAPRAERSVAA
jgi:uncharacterized protein YicC (UPF0701 family)